MSGKRNKNKTKHKSKKVVIIIAILILILGIAAGCFYYFCIYNQNKENPLVDLGTTEGLKEEEPEQPKSTVAGPYIPSALIFESAG